jgi:hypothetical protein
MVTIKKSKRLTWILVILGVIILGVSTFFIIKAVIGDGSSFKEYNTEQTVDDVTVKLNSVQRFPMEREECQERVVLFGNVEDFYCLIANVTITNNTDKEYDYSYRNFGYIEPGTNKRRITAITRITQKDIDITKDMAPGESHTQDVFYTTYNDTVMSDFKITYKVNPKAGEGESEIVLPLK